MTLDPRPVPAASWRRWLVEGLALSTRRVGAFVATGALFVALHGLAARVGLGVALVPLGLAAGCLVAECADHGRGVIATLRGKPPRVLGRLLLAGLVLAAGFWLAGAFVVALAVTAGLEPGALAPLLGGAVGGGGEGGGVGAPRALAATLSAAWFLSVAAALFGASVAIGFLVPLLALAEAPFREALVLSLRATARNPFAMVFVMALSLSALIGLVTPYLVVPWTAVVAATLYAAYRDVFLGREENVPLRAGATRRSLATG